MEEQAAAALKQIRANHGRPCIVLQNLIEFWSASTRPRDVNGFGFSKDQVEAEVRRLETIFHLLSESPNVAVEWRRLVQTYPTAGKNVHDARLVASMLVHKVTHLLTFNSSDFTRYTEITVFEPQQVITAA